MLDKGLVEGVEMVPSRIKANGVGTTKNKGKHGVYAHIMLKFSSWQKNNFIS